MSLRVFPVVALAAVLGACQHIASPSQGGPIAASEAVELARADLGGRGIQTNGYVIVVVDRGSAWSVSFNYPADPPGIHRIGSDGFGFNVDKHTRRVMMLPVSE